MEETAAEIEDPKLTYTRKAVAFVDGVQEALKHLPMTLAVDGPLNPVVHAKIRAQEAILWAEAVYAYDPEIAKELRAKREST